MERPKSSFSVKNGDGEIVVKMSYGLHSDLMRLIERPERIEELILTDEFLRDFVIRRCLTDFKGSMLDPDKFVSMEDLDVDPLDVPDLLSWVVEHILYFFITSAQKLKPLEEKFRSAAQPDPSKSG